MYYGNSYGYGSSCGCQSVNPCYGSNYGSGYYGGYTNSYAIVLVLFILLIIILGARNWV